MSILSRLFGGGGGTPAPAAAKPEDYEGYRIFVEPIAEGSTFRLAARIEKDLDGETKTHHLIRADTFESHDRAVEATLLKARQVIDESGDRIFS